MGDSALRGIRSQMRRFLSGSVLNLESTTIRSLVDLGITSDQNNGFQLKLDSARFLQALKDSPSSVEGLLAVQGSASDALVSYISHQPATEAGSYDIDIETLATQGRHLADTIVFPGSITIDVPRDWPGP